MGNGALLDADRLIAEARRRAGADDFGADESFFKPLRVLAGALARAGLHDAGRRAAAERIVDLLVDRLRTERWMRRHPEIGDEEIVAPIVIAALPRTGTTMLHRFIAADPRMYAVLWYECRYPVPFADAEPSGRDARIAKATAEVRQMLETYPGLDAIHPMDPVGPDEEIMLLEHAFLSGMPQSMYDVPDYVAHERAADHEPAYRYLKRMLKFLQWQKKRAGQQRRRWVLKSPEHLGYVDVLLRVFPDALVVQSHRDPMQTIPSISSMVLSSWAAFADAPDARRVGRQWCERMADFMRHCMAVRARDPERFVDVWYRDTVRDPFSVAEVVYRAAGLKISDQARGEMARWREENRRGARAAHDYSLERFGFTEAKIAEDFKEYRRAYILDR